MESKYYASYERLTKVLIQSIYLLVPPRITPFIFEDNPISSGQPLQISCFVPTGDLPIQVSWTLNGRNINEFSGVSIGNIGPRNSILVIEAVSYVNAGNYTCTVFNAAGKTSHHAQLLINGYFACSIFISNIT